ncbi:MAG: E3 binding domain-containing protein [Verrucomicrobia bacterium]|nr:E3 binding domain-containing protein [Verrucomicrobiota bacterium]
MSIEIIVPRLGWSMEEGAFVAWLKKSGDRVRPGDPLFSIEGDKAVQEIESMDAGVLRIANNAPAPGAAIRVGDVLGHLLSDDEAGQSAPAEGSPAPHTPPAGSVARPEVPSTSTRKPSTTPVDAHPLEGKEAGGSAGRVAISPRALRLASELGVDWTRLSGSGSTGRIREQDVLLAARSVEGGATLKRQPSPSAAPGPRPQAVFFGELLMRLDAPRHERLVQARQFDVRYTGAEANAAVSCAQLGCDAYVVSAVPDNELGQACLNFIRQYGVNTDHVLRGGSRLGTLYLEAGVPPRASRVIYDRAGSAFTELKPGEVDWSSILPGKKWLHWSGTAAAVSQLMPQVLSEACAAARRQGASVSCDLNYRGNLWSVEDARRVLTPLTRDVDVLIASEEHLRLVLGFDAAALESSGGPSEAFARAAQALRSRLAVARLAVTLRSRNDSGAARWQGLLVDSRGESWSRIHAPPSVDRIGAGDAFSGALIHALMTGMERQEAIEFAAAAGCLKHSIHGDFNLATREEVLSVARGDLGDRVRR